MDLKKIIIKSGYHRLKVIPNQPKLEVRGVVADGTVKIALKAAPAKGKANRELIRFLSSELKISKENIKIVSGLTSRIKIVSIKF